MINKNIAMLSYKNLGLLALFACFMCTSMPAKKPTVTATFVPESNLREVINYADNDSLVRYYHAVSIKNEKYDSIFFYLIKTAGRSKINAFAASTEEKYDRQNKWISTCLINYGYRKEIIPIALGESKLIMFYLPEFDSLDGYTTYLFSVDIDSLGVKKNRNFEISSNVNYTQEQVIIK